MVLEQDRDTERGRGGGGEYEKRKLLCHGTE